MTKNLIDTVIGDANNLELQHRCYNGICLTAGAGCLIASVLNLSVGIPLMVTGIMLSIGIIYIWLYFKGRKSETYKPLLWLYILIGVILLVITWFYNGGIDGSDTFVSMAALVAVIAVLRKNRLVVAMTIFFPTMSGLFLVGYLYPELIVGYNSIGQRFIDVYLSFVISAAVIFTITTMILQSHEKDRKKLIKTNRIIEEKMEILNRTNSDLELALTQIETLNGLLPICTHCKKIRDDKGYWNRIESYIQKHSQAEFSHSICPKCADQLYQEYDLYSE